MLIHVEDDIYITSDDRQFMLSKKVIYTDKESGEEKIHYNAFRFFTTLDSLLNELVNRKLRQSTASTLQELLESVRAIRTDIKANVYL